MKITRRRKLFVVVLGVLCLLYFSRAWLLPPVATFLDVSEPPTQVDYVLVLNGGPETRPFVAAAMVKAGLVNKVLLTTASATADTKSGILPPEHDIVSRVLLARGVTEEQIHIIPGQIASTYDEANALARFLESNPANSVAVVTNDFHTRRTRSIFWRVLGDPSFDLRIVSAPVDHINADNWWHSAAGVKIYTTEYCKSLYYWLRY